MARVVRPLAAVILVHLVLAVCGLANRIKGLMQIYKDLINIIRSI